MHAAERFSHHQHEELAEYLVRTLTLKEPVRATRPSVYALTILKTRNYRKLVRLFGSSSCEDLNRTCRNPYGGMARVLSSFVDYFFCSVVLAQLSSSSLFFSQFSPAYPFDQDVPPPTTTQHGPETDNALYTSLLSLPPLYLFMGFPQMSVAGGPSRARRGALVWYISLFASTRRQRCDAAGRHT